MAKGKVIEKYALEEIPENSRQAWHSIAFIWIGVIICVPALMTGGALMTGLTFAQAFLATVIGFTIVAAFMIPQAMQGADLGRPTVVNASSAFGDSGSRILISLILGTACLGWFGVLTSVCGVAFSGIMSSWMGLTMPVWLSSLAWGIIMLATAIFGFDALKYLNYVAVPVLLLLAIYGTYMTFAEFGTQMILSYHPPTPIPFVQGVAMAVGGFAVGGVIAADVSRYAAGRKDVVLSVLIGVWPAGVAMLFMGFTMAIVAGSYDITLVFTKIGIPAIGVIILIFATWTTNAVNAYSGGLAITMLFGVSDSKRALATGIAGGLGTILAVVGIINHFVNYLTLLSSAIPPIAGVMIADYWVIKKGIASSWSRYTGFNWGGVISWLVGVLVASVIKGGITPINGIAASMACYLAIVIGLGKQGSLR